MEKADKNGAALIEMTFWHHELPKESTKSKILLNGKNFQTSAERLEYQVSYSGQRPKVTEERPSRASTVVDSEIIVCQSWFDFCLRVVLC